MISHKSNFAHPMPLGSMSVDEVPEAEEIFMDAGVRTSRKPLAAQAPEWIRLRAGCAAVHRRHLTRIGQARQPGEPPRARPPLRPCLGELSHRCVACVSDLANSAASECWAVGVCPADTVI